MLRVLLTLVALSFCLAGAEQKAAKSADIEIIEVAARHDEGNINLDGRLRNGSSKPIRGLVLTFDFVDAGGKPLTTQSAPVEEEILDPGAEASFHLHLNTPARAVQFRISAADEGKRGRRVSHPGPFPID
jgi:hypothetical protein